MSDLLFLILGLVTGIAIGKACYCLGFKAGKNSSEPPMSDEYRAKLLAEHIKAHERLVLDKDERFYS